MDAIHADKRTDLKSKEILLSPLITLSENTIKPIWNKTAK